MSRTGAAGKQAFVTPPVAQAIETVRSVYPDADLVKGRFGRVRIAAGRHVLSGIQGVGTSVARRQAAWIDAAERVAREFGATKNDVTSGTSQND